MKCNKCQCEISFVDKAKLSLKNMYTISCPNCGIKLKMTSVSRFIYTIILVTVILVNASLLRDLSVTNVSIAMLLILFAMFFVQPLVANYEEK